MLNTSQIASTNQKTYWQNPSVVFGLIIILIASYWILYPGLFGPYILDDLAHFPKLKEGVYDKNSLVEWVFSSGHHGSGRILSYLSFLIDDNAWPNLPQDLKHTNLLLHLITGVLVFSFVRLILLIVFTEYSEKKNGYLALLMAFLWLIAPVHQSAIFMAIQRMTLLMGLFVFSGLNFYVLGRMRIHDRPVSGYLFISIGIGLFGVLGVFSKEPAVLICLYALVLEGTVLRSVQWKDVYRRYWMTVFLFIPLLLIILFYMFSFSSMEGLYAKRDFTMFQRLITEPRVIASYVAAILYPLSSTVGPYFDDFVASKGFFVPLTTVISSIVLLGTLFIALRIRKIYPLLSFGVLFFLAGHVLESTILPLELYFEHRNYVASIGVFFMILAVAKILMSLSLSSVIKHSMAVVLFTLLAVQFVSSIMTARTWGSREEQISVWAYYHPHSLRSQLDSIRLWLSYGMIDKVGQNTKTLLTEHPNSTGLHLFLKLIDLCRPDYNISLYGNRDLQRVLANGKYSHVVMESISFLNNNRITGRCDISKETLQSYVMTLLGNNKFFRVNSAVVSLYQDLAKLNDEAGDYKAAITNLDKAYDRLPYYNIALTQTYLAIKNGAYSDARIFIEKARHSPHINKYDFIWREEGIDAWEKALNKSMAGE